MLSLAILIASIPTNNTWDIAMCARFYYPVGDKRKSKRRYYLLSLDGKRRKEIGNRPLAEDEASFIAWKDRNHVVWFENSDHHADLIEYTVSTRKSRSLLRTKWTRPHDYIDTYPAPIQKLMDRYSPDPLVTQATVTDSDPSAIQLRGRKIPIQNAKVKWQVTYGANGIDEHSLFILPGYPSQLEYRGTSGDWRLMGFGGSLTAHEGIYYLFRVNPKKGKAAIIPADVVEISSRPSRDLWIGISDRNLGEYAETDVWTNALSIGRITKGQPKKIPFGRVMISHASLRP